MRGSRVLTNAATVHPWVMAFAFDFPRRLSACLRGSPGPMYSNPVVKRVRACFKLACRVPGRFARAGGRTRRQAGDFSRDAIKAGCVVVLDTRWPRAFQSAAQKFDSACPMP